MISFFTLAFIPNKELYSQRKFCIVLREGPKDLLFEDEATNDPHTGEEEDFNGIDQAVFGAGNRMEDIKFVQNQGLSDDNDNNPALGNVPQAGVSFASLFDGQYWGYNGTDQKATSVQFDQEPSFQGGWRPAKESLLDIFKKMVPLKIFLDIIVELTSSAHIEQKYSSLCEGEFPQYLRMWILMLTCSGWTRNNFWSKKRLVGNGPACPLENLRTHLRTQDMSRTCPFYIPGHFLKNVHGLKVV